MKKLFSILFLGLLLGFTSWAQVKIGMPAGAPQTSAVLDLSNTGDGTRALILPRVANTAAILLPVQGMLVYDISSNSIKAYENASWTSYLTPSSSATPVVAVNCAASAINGLYTQNNLLTAANTVTIVVANNSFSNVLITPSLTDIVLTGVAAPGMAVTAFSPATITPGSGGGTSTITYTITGTPTTIGTFTATWTKLSLTCAKTSSVCLDIAPITVSSVTNPASLPLVTADGNTVTFTAAGGTPNTGLTWAMTSYPATGIFSSATTGTGATAVATLIAGANGVVTVTYTAVNACGLAKTGTQTVTVNATYVNCAGSSINGIYTQNVALTAANTITMKLVNNDVVAQTIPTSTGDILFGNTAGINIASVSPASLVLAPNGGTGTITYSLSGTTTPISVFTANWSIGNLTCVTTGRVCANITPITVSNVTNPATLPSPTVAGNTVTFTAAGGTPNSALTWVMSSLPSTGVFTNAVTTGTGATAVATLAAGAVGTVTVTYTATNLCGLIVTGTQTANVNNVVVNCATSAINGAYTLNTALTAANTITMVVTNSGNAVKTVTPAIGDVVLTGTGIAGITVASVSAPVNIAAGATSTLTYTLSGTPTTAGTLIATWTNQSMTCVKNSNVCAVITPITVTNVTNPTTLPIPAVAGNTITFTAAGGTPNTGLTWAMTSSVPGTLSGAVTGTGTTALATLAAGTGTVTVTYTATNICGVIVTGTQTVNVGGDALRAALAAAGCTSCTAYDAAAADTWVNISAAEYAQIDNFMPVNVAGVIESVMTMPSGGIDGGGWSFVVQSPNAALLPANNYVVAFSVVTASANTSNDVLLKYSPNANTGFTTGGPTVKLTAAGANTRVYNIMKRPSAVVNAAASSYVAIFTGAGGNWLTFVSPAGSSRYYASGDVSNLSANNATNGIEQYQVKGTATRKWQ